MFDLIFIILDPKCVKIRNGHIVLFQKHSWDLCCIKSSLRDGEGVEIRILRCILVYFPKERYTEMGQENRLWHLYITIYLY